ncbi:Serine/threonine protein kinase [Nocardioides terrae]|uniref:non-specific serine/threonine protein kinase n=1 Tax=Nocardioides terrae TaxID=574651 RepID=A0A1I1DFQ8_9ACTN|nr:serine/threonine-protein kinase [Nocardioides terrae]SFB73771.1 Serine/threonine protein kinase [Nocardioides terrae]
MTVESEPVAGRYRLIREVGRGGMGAVWLAHDELLGRDVALKRLGHFEGVQSRVRAEREAQLAARLSHPNVVTVFDLAEDDDTRWLVMEYVEGTTLSRLAALRDGLPLDEAAAIIRQAAEALRVAHAAGIVHRDVKPSNLIVALDGTTKLTDFGIARGDADDTLTATGILTGSPAYLAPEVASGTTATPASDMWSLGGTLFQAVTGRTPYELGDNVVAGLVRIVHDDPPRLPAGSGPLGTVLAATMVKDPASRWTAAQVCDFLDTVATAPPGASLPLPTDGPDSTQVLPETPTAARPARPARRAPAARSRLVWPVMAAVLILVLVLGGWLLSRSRSPNNEPSATSTSTSGPAKGATGTPQTSTTQAAKPTAEEMTSFLRGYLTTVTSDTRAAFAMLTPSFQQASGGYAGYDSFWKHVHQATPSGIRADPEELTVSYHVDYAGPKKKVSGGSDDVRLQLVYDGAGHYLIDGEPK